MGMCCEKKKMIGWKKCLKWRVPDKEVDQRGLLERLCKKTGMQIEKRLKREDSMDRSRWRKLIKDD